MKLHDEKVGEWLEDSRTGRFVRHAMPRTCEDGLQTYDGESAWFCTECEETSWKCECEDISEELTLMGAADV